MSALNPEQKEKERFFRAHIKASDTLFEAAEALNALSMLISQSELETVAEGAEAEDLYQGLGKLLKIMGDRLWDVHESACVCWRPDIRAMLGLPPETKGDAND